MGRISRSWQLVRSSWSVLRADKELLLYPVASSIATFVAMVLIFLVRMQSGGLERLDGDGFGILDLVMLYVFFVVVSAVVVFFNAALIAGANIRLEGGDPTLGDGFRIAISHLPSIIAWALIAATVGVVLSVLRDRGGALGSIASLIGGAAWSLITFMVVPILVVESVGPKAAIGRSASLLRETWGEQIVGGASIKLAIGLTFVAVLFVGGIVVYLLFVVSDALGLVGGTVLVAGLIFLALIGSALSGIFNIALYRHASGKGGGDFFPRETLVEAFHTKGE